ncbi:hypothetical protein CANINC_002119 [Pichia inconspicua]|uniref:Replication protein A C-terminal domain-containing protein n=1 Tax=Pichia inconspicua TaxID=52247 RepID=A0A4T0X1X8_9ASCO|nr:hypothetical protein CANINC_002119 [[Candida] inconspicua]
MNYAAYSDGGFDPSSNNNGGSAGGFGSESNKPRWATQFISPVTIKMIKDATFENGPDAAFFTHGIELSYVRFVGMLRAIEEQETHRLLTVEDGTGSIQVRLWNREREGGDEYGEELKDEEEDDQDNVETELKLLQYVDIVATVKDFNQKAQVQVQNVNVITDFNIIPYHLLNVAKNYLTNKHGAIMTTTNTTTTAGESLFVGNDGTGSTAGVTGGTTTDRVIGCIREQSKSMPDGVPVNFIASTLELAIDDVQTAVAELHQEGLIFSTDDDDMYLPL